MKDPNDIYRNPSRRRFLKSGAAALGSVLVPGWLPHFAYGATGGAPEK